MCKNPSLHQLVEMIRLDKEAAVKISEQKAAIERANKEAAKNVLLGIQLQLARRTLR